MPETKFRAVDLHKPCQHFELFTNSISTERGLFTLNKKPEGCAGNTVVFWTNVSKIVNNIYASFNKWRNHPSLFKVHLFANVLDPHVYFIVSNNCDISFCSWLQLLSGEMNNCVGRNAPGWKTNLDKSLTVQQTNKLNSPSSSSEVHNIVGITCRRDFTCR